MLRGAGEKIHFPGERKPGEPHEVRILDEEPFELGMHALRELAGHFSGYELSSTVVVSPDLGYAKQAALFARMLGVPVAAALTSSRLLQNFTPPALPR